MTAVDAILAGASVVIGLADIHRGRIRAGVAAVLYRSEPVKIDRSIFTDRDRRRYALTPLVVTAPATPLGVEQFTQPETPPLPGIAWRPGGWRT